MQYSKSENYKYLVIEASHGDHYGFNTTVKRELEIAMNIVSDYDDFMVKGWKVSKKLPEWVNTADSWIAFINGKDMDDKKHDDDKEEGEYEKEEDEVEDDEEDEEAEEEAECENEDNVEEGAEGESKGENEDNVDHEEERV